MGNKDKRAARKAEKEKQRRVFLQQKRGAIRHAQRMLAEVNALPSLDTVIASVRPQHSSLLAIVKMDQDSTQDTEEALAANGLPEYRVRTFSIEDGQYLHVQPERFGGHMSVVTRDDREYRTVICLKVSSDAERPNADMIAAAGRICCMASLSHELGHVEDFEQQRHLILGQPMDTMKAELYAHEYACRLMSARSWHLALAFYIGQGLPQFIKCSSPTIAEAGRRFAESLAVQQYRRLVGERYLALWPPTA